MVGFPSEQIPHEWDVAPRNFNGHPFLAGNSDPLWMIRTPYMEWCLLIWSQFQIHSHILCSSIGCFVGKREYHLGEGIMMCRCIAGTLYTTSMYGRVQLFARDPDGNTVEFQEARK
jgi:hypothetical protein